MANNNETQVVSLLENTAVIADAQTVVSQVENMMRWYTDSEKRLHESLQAMIALNTRAQASHQKQIEELKQERDDWKGVARESSATVKWAELEERITKEQEAKAIDRIAEMEKIHGERVALLEQRIRNLEEALTRSDSLNLDLKGNLEAFRPRVIEVYHLSSHLMELIGETKKTKGKRPK